MTSDVQGNAAFGWCLILGGVCFVGRATVALVAGPPPSEGCEILAWIGASRLALMLGNEALVVGAGLLLAGFYGAQRVLVSIAPMKTVAGSMLLVAGSIVCFVLGIVQGRFVYPVHGISLTRPNDAELLAAVYFGGYHLVALVFAAATACWSLAMLRSAKWAAHGYFGFAIAVGSVLSSYPDLIGPFPVFALESALASWWIAIGYWLKRTNGLVGDANV